MADRILRVVFSGYGQRGEFLARRLAGEQWCRVVAIADPSAAALRRATSLYQVSVFADFSKLLAATDADVAAICTPRHLLHEHAAAALQAGLQVLLAQAPEKRVDGATILEPEPGFLARWRAALRK